jgi:putative ABC transport system substrate-binding protein
MLEYRDGGGRAERLPERARELIALNVDLIVAYGPPDIEAAMRATRTIPIVMGVHSGDPVRSGFVASLARPGGNVTGVSSVASELIAKRVELLREVRPGIARVGVLWDLAAGPVDRLEAIRSGSNAAAKILGIRWHPIPVRVPQDFPAAFDTARRERVEGMLFGPDTQFLRSNLAQLAALAVTYRLPTVADRDAYAEGGFLMAYGPDLRDLFARAAHHVDKIFRGASPAELPVEQPTKFDLVINLKTAKALGLTIPPSLLTRAHQVIQ